METTNENAYKKAQKRVKKLKKFYNHLFSYLIINSFLVGLNLYQNPHNPWSLWVIFGWGIGLTSHALRVFAPDIFFGKNWEERKIRELMEQEK
ncbi:2TM domain-containing protein [Capnocytophaga catalasegens]|uniref:Histidine kinase n=1 Tax=Capnocytophaga catalasegens TaxID=1004260 RepID=A0AAV5B0U1_9FLAO|nr:2TM domain-containing protein [Capnocytophaga catalasegens]GIZ14416.1 histidine kinase [Capnocytophaga catalasegens]GJM51651.1 histidine kinase [Capnocytophaga catalasegens]GJM54275.1 histidine kinase [Capnocytophaga catalasegens]